MLKTVRHRVAQALTGCFAVLWLTGFLSVGQGNLTPHWMAQHCPNGQTQPSHQSHTHCAWHCSGFDVQSGGGRIEITADVQVSLVWSLGTIPVQDAVLDGQFPPRGPPQIAFEIA